MAAGKQRTWVHLVARVACWATIHTVALNGSHKDDLHAANPSGHDAPDKREGSH